MKYVLQKKIRTTESKLRQRLLELLEKSSPRSAKADITSRRLSDIEQLIGLSSQEQNLIAFIYCYGQSECFERFCNCCKLPSFLKLVSVATECPMWQLRRILAHKAKLVSSGIIDRIDPDLNPPVRLDDEVSAYLAGIVDMPLADKYCRKATGRTLNLNSFNMPAKSIDIACALISQDGKGHVLLHGSPGTGKTEFAKSIVAHTGKEAFFVQHGEEKSRSGDIQLNRKMALQVALSCVPENKGVLVVDEADELLNTRYFMFGSDKSPDKGWLNMFMDSCERQIIWITNDTDFMEESTLRRFSYSLHFKRFTRQERENIWRDLLKRHPMRRYLAESDIKNMAVSYNINAAGISSALQTLKTIIPKENADSENVKSALTELLDRHMAAIGRKKPSNLNLITTKYDLSALNVDVSPQSITRSLASFSDKRKAESCKKDGNINLLFWGPPGTGKTEYAKHLANTLSMNLLFKRSSDLQSCWVGETEKNIRDAFEEAERDRAILFLDEADSFFINRQTATRSWENSQTNELLTQMENHKGILICCTNLLEHLDHAVSRRFLWKINFKPLTSEGKVRLFRKYFVSDRKRPLDQHLLNKIEAIPELTPGDIKVVWQKYQFADSDDRNYENIIQALETEVSYKKGVSQGIGFCS
ncbi:MAG: ATP-binding protein [Candidatus Atribacteria bacterium]|nr:MAG: ATP-binding protein [Candidatus Atribacteria bacterium]